VTVPVLAEPASLDLTPTVVVTFELQGDNSYRVTFSSAVRRSQDRSDTLIESDF